MNSTEVTYLQSSPPAGALLRGGHKWRLVDDQPWRRAYVVLKPGARDLFVPKPRAP